MARVDNSTERCLGVSLFFLGHKRWIHAGHAELLLQQATAFACKKLSAVRRQAGDEATIQAAGLAEFSLKQIRAAAVQQPLWQALAFDPRQVSNAHPIHHLPCRGIAKVGQMNTDGMQLEGWNSNLEKLQMSSQSQAQPVTISIMSAGPKLSGELAQPCCLLPCRSYGHGGHPVGNRF